MHFILNTKKISLTTSHINISDKHIFKFFYKHNLHIMYSKNMQKKGVLKSHSYELRGIFHKSHVQQSFKFSQGNAKD